MKQLSIRSVGVLAFAALGLVVGLALDGFAGCAPGCKICLLDVCSDGPQQRPGVQKPPEDQRPKPLSNDANPLVNIENQLGNLQPSDTSEPVTEWVGMSGRDFALTMIHAFVAAGNCIEVRDLRNEVAQLSGRYGDGNRWVTDLADRQNQYEQERRAAQSIAAKTGETLEGLSREDIGYIVQHYSAVSDWNYTAPWLRQRIIESRARNRAKEPEVRKKLQAAEATLYKNYDCQKEGWWR